ncbi:MAG TPA: ATP-binding protein [Pseudonocardiaceae bacterium]|nr:ATP-binding protein [Pseudonocardiaceae bacterium]
MDWLLDRRKSSGRRSSDERDELALKGLLHDLEHGMATLSSLVEVVCGDDNLSIGSRIQLERMDNELTRLADFLSEWADRWAGATQDGTVNTIDLRALAGEVAQLAEVEHGANVVLVPGPSVRLAVRPGLVWRILANMVDNAARAAGPCGAVEVTITETDSIVVEVRDDGPGFGGAPSSGASLGLTVIASLLRSIGGHFELRDAPEGGTVVRAIFPPPPKRALAERPASATPATWRREQ